ncbi:MAG: universal stress protein [Nitrospiraceae bacterium]|nr:MAG: universal stress protein [Nitrospiraceae bacterium]
MKRFKNIMYVNDGRGIESESFIRAMTLADNNKARLKVVEVIEDVPSELLALMRTKKIPDPKEIISITCTDTLTHMGAAAKNRGLDTSTRLLTGTPFIELIREVIRGKHDLVIMSPSAEEGLKEFFFGSTAMHMMRKCPCPVWVIKKQQKSKFAKILAAVDPPLSLNETDSVKTDLNKKIMELSSSLARLEKSELHVVHTWELYLETMLRNRAGLSQSDINDMIEESKRNHVKMVNELIMTYSPGLPEKRIHILKGRAGYMIPEVAREIGIELIVMGTVSRTGIAGLFIGNTAEEILGRVDCSVLTVKPDGFETPIHLQ